MAASIHSQGVAGGSGRRRWADAALCALLLVIPLLGYLRTMRPTFGWGDSSELTTAAYFLGNGHSPGYPTWMLIAHLFARLPIGNVAFRVNFMTALLGALAIPLLYLAFQRISGSRAAAFIAALTFAFAATFWDMTTEAEVYTLHICFAALILLVTLRWRREAVGAGEPRSDSRAGDRWLFLGAWLVGISLGNHALTALMLPAIIYLIWSEKGGRFFRPRRVALCAGFLLLGLTVYAYEPIRGVANPPPHINNPHTLRDFWDQLTAPGARHSMFDAPILSCLQRAWTHFRRLPFEFGITGCALALVGLASLWRRDRRLAAFLLLIGGVDVAYSCNFSIFDIYIYYLPLHVVVASFIAVGAASALALSARALSRLRSLGLPATPAWQYGPLTALLLALPFGQFTTHLPWVDGSQDYSAERFARAVFRQIEPGAMILADWWTIAPMGYLKYVEGQRQDVVMFAAPSIWAEEGFVDFAQEDFLRRYPAVYYVEMLTNRADIMRKRFYLVPEGPVARVLLDRPNPESLRARIDPTPIVRFGDHFGLVKVQLENHELRPGASLGFTLYWTALSRYNGRPHEAILFLESPNGERIWQESNKLLYNLYPFGEWKPGDVFREEHRIYLWDPAPAGEYKLVVRVREAGQSASLTCDQPGGGRDYVAATIRVAPADGSPSPSGVPAVVAALRP